MDRYKYIGDIMRVSEGGAIRYLCDWAMLLYDQWNMINYIRFKNYCEMYGMKYFTDR